MNPNPTIQAHVSSANEIEGAEGFLRWWQELQQELVKSQQRGLVLLSGARPWLQQAVEQIAGAKSVFIISDANDIHATTNHRHADRLLGREACLVVLDIEAALGVDTICMASGLVQAGGCLVLLASTHGPNQADQFFAQWLFSQLDDWSNFYRFSQTEQAPPLPPLPFSEPTEVQDGLTSDQQRELAHLHAWSQDTSTPVFVLTADRGRGKSTLLGCFAATGCAQKILVTAASKSHAGVLLNQAGKQSPVSFIAPDELIRRGQVVELLIIDEAAMLPVGMLQRCLELAEKTVLVTTTGGYEGTGQGFLIKFLQKLQTGKYLHASMDQPVRWGNQDLLERALGHILMLDSVPSEAVSHRGDELVLTVHDVHSLRSDINLLRAIYRLLTSAHYRTRPSDLQRLLEDEAKITVVASCNAHVAGVMVLSPEGGMDQALCDEIFMGRRRPAGHLLAQMLTAQAGIRGFAHYRGYRIQRIAVNPSLRRRGIGRRLVDEAKALMRRHELDYVGSSFALDDINAAFWRANGFKPVHISAGSGKSSGRKTIAVLDTRAGKIRRLIDSQQRRLISELPVILLTFGRDMYWRDINALLRLLAVALPAEHFDQLDQIHAFARGYRGLEYTRPALQRFLIEHWAETAELEASLQRLLIERVFLDRDQIVRHASTRIEGRKKELAQIRRITADLLASDSFDQHLAKASATAAAPDLNNHPL